MPHLDNEQINNRIEQQRALGKARRNLAYASLAAAALLTFVIFLVGAFHPTAATRIAQLESFFLIIILTKLAIVAGYIGVITLREILVPGGPLTAMLKGLSTVPAPAVTETEKKGS